MVNGGSWLVDGYYNIMLPLTFNAPATFFGKLKNGEATDHLKATPVLTRKNYQVAIKYEKFKVRNYGSK